MKTSIAMAAAALTLVFAVAVSARDAKTAPANESSLTVPLVTSDLLKKAKELDETGGWQPFRPGVTAHWLYKEGNVGPAAVLLRYEPGARVALHEHVGYEHLLILKGDQFDENGSYPAGSFVINPPGTRHSPGSKGGCIALLIYEKAVQFVGQE